MKFIGVNRTNFIYSSFFVFALLICSAVSTNQTQAQTTLNNQGIFANKGKIRLKSGNPAGLPDTLGGAVEFGDTNSANTQMIPNISFRKLLLSGGSVKIADSAQSGSQYKNAIVASDSLIISLGTTLKLDRAGLEAKNAVDNNSIITGSKYLILNGLNEQIIKGNGHIDNLMLDNESGAAITNGKTKIGKSLSLKQGELKTNSDGILSISDSVRINRWSGSLLGSAPVFEGSVSLGYFGADSIITGLEIPESGMINDLTVENNGGIRLTRDISTFGDVDIGTGINTIGQNSELYSIKIATGKNPVYRNSEASINGRMLIENINPNEKIYLNNSYTYLKFEQIPESLKLVSSDIREKTKPSGFANNETVERSFALEAFDNNGNKIDYGIDAEFGYGWRRTSNTEINECNIQDIQSAALLFITDSNPKAFKRLSVPEHDIANGWAKGVSHIDRFGEFAVGKLDMLLRFAVKVWLEGAYRNEEMTTFLTETKKITHTPPDIFPYNLDKQRDKIVLQNIPDSAVDWITIEFREKLTDGNRFYKTCLLMSDGSVAEPNGESVIDFSTTGIKAGTDYYIAVLHKNHLAIVTEMPESIACELAGETLDFSNPANVMGGKSAMKSVYDVSSGSFVYAMPAGDSNFDGAIDAKDYEAAWLNINKTGHPTDFDFDGITNISDFNKSWNNRGRVSFLKY